MRDTILGEHVATQPWVDDRIGVALTEALRRTDTIRELYELDCENKTRMHALEGEVAKLRELLERALTAGRFDDGEDAGFAPPANVVHHHHYYPREQPMPPPAAPGALGIGANAVSREWQEAAPNTWLCIDPGRGDEEFVLVTRFRGTELEILREPDGEPVMIEIDREVNWSVEW
jgi:hypothetical protein